MMKYSYILLLLVLWTVAPAKASESATSTLPRKEQRADDFFQRQSFQSAATLYEALLTGDEGNVRVRLKAAESYYALNDPQRAAEHYAYASWTADAQHVLAHHRWHYAQTLVRTGQLAQAEQMLTVYLAEAPDHQAAQNLLIGLQQRADFYADSARYTLKALSSNSSEADFSPAFYQDGLVFASNRQEKGHQKTYHRDLGAYLHLYYTPPANQQPVDTAQRLFGKRLVSLHQGPAVFYANDSKMLLTTNNPSFKKDRGQPVSFNRLQLLYAEKNNEGTWTEPVALPFNNAEYSVGHPAVTADGTRLYFCSDRPGGFGGTDLYVSRYENGTWGNPVNLGEQVNTDGDEMFPFVHNDQALYFASTGHPGLGGLDVFKVDLSLGDTATVHNLGYPINTSEDDFGMILRADGASGYVSSHRAGQDDIYQIGISSEAPNGIPLVVEVIDGLTDQPIPNVRLFLKRLVMNERMESATDSLGRVYLTAAENAIYDLAGELNGRHWNHPPINTQGMKKDEENVVKIYLFDQVTDFDAMDVVIFDRYHDDGDVLVSMNQRLFQWGEENGQCYLLGENRKILLSRISQGDAEPVGLLEKIEQVFEEGGIALRSITTIENVFFDFDRSTLRADAQKTLEKLVSVVERYPLLRISLSGHTDSRGTDAYNDQLSERRSESVVKYLLDQGIASERLQESHWGEQRLVNHCLDGVPCTAQQHQSNRRVAFGIQDFLAPPELVAAD
jgi:outer membrane protein OmpA-like peptidoglycan-associated protein/tetratricopeptide (TPR) repeat protein